MCLKFVESKLGKLDKAYIIPISDAHNGAKRFDREKFKKMVTDIKNNDNFFAVLIGDLLNNATKHSKSDVYEETMSPKEQKKDMIAMLSEIQNKLLGSTGGNHEERTSRDSGVDLSEDIADALKIPYDPTGILYSVKVGQSRNKGCYNYTIYTTHGSGGGGSVGSSMNKLHSLRNIVVADVYMMGHTHKIGGFPDKIYIPDTRHSKIIEITRKYCMAGSYLDWGDYAERLMLSPAPTGFSTAMLDGTRKNVTITF
jgi:predicted phosphodiesterase